MRYLSKDILEEVITQRPSDSYKSNFGRVVLIGGNRQYGGAIIMIPKRVSIVALVSPL